MHHSESELEKALVLTLFIPLIMGSGDNSGFQATSLLGVILGLIGIIRITLDRILKRWRALGPDRPPAPRSASSGFIDLGTEAEPKSEAQAE